jgi:hypothetical protein
MIKAKISILAFADSVLGVQPMHSVGKFLNWFSAAQPAKLADRRG